ncbi:TetR/AcrR family transcriptional regulator C-terminal domain-containing protein [Microbacterium sp. SS28]|uniref:TetR/AcrR family transcriptional regulator C-terminal domain-containing protein n=1 Tax=Microbacterium sp. SS28 TaxID=2919948 RepID=UPI001FA9C336|nr:TetR/AcrR family transcriptional regulator C-terminal domain-containing protein [Microbacterium sp. SS28]
MALTRQDVITGALELADAEGLDALTLRSLAGRLGVQAPTLYWHVRNKAELLDALADRIMDDVLAGLAPPDADWRDWLLRVAIGMRGILLRHPDGARIIGGGRASLRRADFSERAITALIDAGVSLREARLTVLAVERFTVGYVLEEQAPPPDDSVRPPAPEELARRLPNVTRAIIDYFQDGRTADDLFQDEIRLILRM